MKAAVLFTLIALFTLTTAYSTPGAYERMWFYYSYLADVEAGQGTASKIAEGCPKVMGTGGPPCSFNQFVAYIEGRSEAYSLTDEARPDVDTMARTLDTNGVTGAYSKERIISGELDGTFSSLFVKVGTYLSSSVLFAFDDDTIKDSIKHALTAVVRTRMAASMEELEKVLTKNGITPHTKDTPVYPGSDETVKFIDGPSTNRDEANAGKDVKGVIRGFWDAGHRSNIDSARQAAAKISEACVYASAA